MKNAVSMGATKSFTVGAPYFNVVSGQAVVNGALLGVSVTDAEADAVATLQIEGVFELPKASAAVIADGARLTWDLSAAEFGTGLPATGDLVGCAVAMSAAGAGVATVIAKLTPGVGVVTA